MRPWCLYHSVVLAVGHAAVTAAQDSGTRSGELHLRVVDASTGRPLLRTWLHQWGRASGGNLRYLWYSRGDGTDGVLSLLRAGHSSAEVLCMGEDRLYGGRRIGLLDSTQVARLSSADTLLFPVDAGGCDRSPLVPQYGTWRGHHSSGFELSDLRLCEDSTRKIWVEYAPGAQERSPVKWPARSRDSLPYYFVAFRGTLVGPFAYGHFAVSEYLLTVDSVLFTRLPSPNDCQGRAPWQEDEAGRK